MAESFNLNKFLNEYSTYNNRQYTAAENGQAAMERREEERAQAAIQQQGFLGITLSEKMAEAGIGERVVKQIGDTAANTVGQIIAPISDWLEKYEHVYDERIYKEEMQGMGKQMFFAMQELSSDAAQKSIGQNFVYTM